MYFRSMKKTAGDVSLSDCIETGKDGNALSLMDVLCSDEDLFEDLSARQTYKKLYEVMNECCQSVSGWSSRCAMDSATGRR